MRTLNKILGNPAGFVMITMFSLAVEVGIFSYGVTTKDASPARYWVQGVACSAMMYATMFALWRIRTYVLKRVRELNDSSRARFGTGI